MKHVGYRSHNINDSVFSFILIEFVHVTSRILLLYIFFFSCSGVILLNGTSFYIEPLKYSSTEHLVYDSRNVNRPKHKCGK